MYFSNVFFNPLSSAIGHQPFNPKANLISLFSRSLLVVSMFYPPRSNTLTQLYEILYSRFAHRRRVISSVSCSILHPTRRFPIPSNPSTHLQLTLRHPFQTVLFLQKECRVLMEAHGSKLIIKKYPRRELKSKFCNNEITSCQRRGGRVSWRGPVKGIAHQQKRSDRGSFRSKTFSRHVVVIKVKVMNFRIYVLLYERIIHTFKD